MTITGPENKRGAEYSAPEPERDSSAEALARFGGKKDLYERMLVKFADDLPDRWSGFDEAVRNGKETEGFVHKIKGVAGNMCEKDIYESAVEFEQTLRAGSPDKEKYERLITACDNFKRRVAGQMKKNGESLTEAGSLAELKINLSRLKEALEAYDLKKCTEAMNLLDGKDWPPAAAGRLQKISGLVRKYDYSAALDELVALMEVIR